MHDSMIGSRLRRRFELESLDDRTMPSAAGGLASLPAASFPGIAALVRDAQSEPPALAEAPAAGGRVRGGVSPTGLAAEGSAARREIRYMEFTIDHHAMGVEMAELCLEKAVSTDLKDLCGRIAEDQSQEITQLQGYLREWYGIDYQPQMSRGDQRQLDRLARLSGPEFDVELSRMFIRHHEQIIDRSMREHTRFVHPELVQFADHVIDEQSREIGEFLAVINSYRGHRTEVGAGGPSGRAGLFIASPDVDTKGFGDVLVGAGRR